MAFMASNLKSLLSVKLKNRHDSKTDQFSRILVAKIFLVASLIMGVDWFHDTVNCILPKNSDLKDEYIYSACWIKGFYIYPELGRLMRKSSHYGIPKNLAIDGIYNGTNFLCTVKERYGDSRHGCVPLRKHYFAQYQWMPFFVASCSLFFYLPYIMYRAANSDMISLRDDVKGPHDLVAHEIIETYFDHNINSKSKMRWRVIFNLIIKFVYIAVNVLTFSVFNLFLNSHFRTYGKDWTNWAQENTSYAFDFDARLSPTPGNQMLPTFGMCNIHESNFDSTSDYGNQHKVICEISSNILYQYVFLVLWFILVLSITVSILGVFISIYDHIVSAAIFVKNDKKAKYVYRFLTFRECEYLEYIRRKNLRLYGDVIRLLREMKLEHLTSAFHEMQDGIRDLGKQLDHKRNLAYDPNGYNSDAIHDDNDNNTEDKYDNKLPHPTMNANSQNYNMRNMPSGIYREPVYTSKGFNERINNFRNRLSSNETNFKTNKVPLIKRGGGNIAVGKSKSNFGGGGRRR